VRQRRLLRLRRHERRERAVVGCVGLAEGVDPTRRPGDRRPRSSTPRPTVTGSWPPTTSCSMPTAASGSATTACTPTTPTSAQRCCTPSGRRFDDPRCGPWPRRHERRRPVARRNPFYVAETYRGRVLAWDVTGPGEVADPGTRRSSTMQGAPRCSTRSPSTPTARSAWRRCSPAGSASCRRREVEFVATGDPLTTNICFGGDDLRTAWITSSGTGRLLRCRWPVAGSDWAHRLTWRRSARSTASATLAP
jgi:hypothetical protein